MPTPNELYDQAADLRDQGDKEGAVAKLEEAVAIDPDFAIGHGMLAKLYADLANADKAIEHARKVVELEPDDAFSYHRPLGDLPALRPHPRGRARQGDGLPETNGIRLIDRVTERHRTSGSAAG